MSNTETQEDPVEAAMEQAEADLESLADDLVGPPPEFTPANLRRFAMIQPTQAEIAAFFDVSSRTVIRRMKQPRFAAAWEAGRAAGQLSIRRFQLRYLKAGGSSGATILQHLSRHWLGETDKSLVEVGGKGGGPIALAFDPAALARLSIEELRALESLAQKLGGAVPIVPASGGDPG